LQGILDALPVEILFRFKELEKIADEKKDAYKLLP
jgi:hypothetical protein